MKYDRDTKGGGNKTKGNIKLKKSQHKIFTKTSSLKVSSWRQSINIDVETLCLITIHSALIELSKSAGSHRVKITLIQSSFISNK